MKEKKATRARINRYAKEQEERMEKAFKAIDFECTDDISRRRKNAGDRVVKDKHSDVVICADHKSTRSEKTFSITTEMLQKIKEDATRCGEAEAVPAITFTFLNHRGVYIVLELRDLERVVGG